MHWIHAPHTEPREVGGPATAAVEAMLAQAQLTIGKSDDPLEVEADAAADRVMRMPDLPVVRGQCAECEEEPQLRRNPVYGGGARVPQRPLVHRKCAECAKEEDSDEVLRRQAVAASITPFALALRAPGAGATPNATAANATALTSGGSPLSAPTKSFMESRFGVDFSHVRVHADQEAATTARALSAQAFTLGSHIHFDGGRYAPDTHEGRRLLAHELAHVVQQRGMPQRYVQRQIEGCSQLLAIPSLTTLISGRAVHQAIEAHFMNTVPGATRVGIPGASAGPLRSQGICGDDSPVIVPQQVGGLAGAGYPDLARITPGGILQVAEVKPAAIPCLVDGEEQELRYIDQGNARDPSQVAWRASLGVTVVSPMLPSTYTPPPLVVPPVVVTTAWCTAGLLAYSVQPLPPPVRVPDTGRERDKSRERRDAPTLTPALVPVGVRRSAWQDIAEWARSVYEGGEDATKAAERFLAAHPELVGAVIGAGIGAIIGLIADDATLVGIADDVLVPIIGALEWVAIRLAWVGATAGTLTTVTAR